jgi:hypothetical protein
MWIGYIIVTSLYARAFAEYSMALLSIRQRDCRHFCVLFCFQMLKSSISGYLLLAIVLTGFAYQRYYQRHRKAKLAG